MSQMKIPSRPVSVARVPICLLLAIALLGCPGDASDGDAPLLRLSSTPECLVFAGGFPPGLTALPGAASEAAVVQFLPTAVLGVDLDGRPPGLLASDPIPGLPELVSPRCGGLRSDSDSDGRSDPDRSDELGFRCLDPAAGNLRAVSSDRVALTTSGYEQVLLLDPRDGRLATMQLETPAAGPDFDPADWPFWPAAGSLPFQTGFSTRACVYGAGLVDSLGDPIGANTRCDAGREGFATTFSADAVRVGDRLFVVTSNLIRSSTAQFAPGTVLVFDFDLATTPPRVGPSARRAILTTTGYNPTSLAAHTTPSGRELVLVGTTGALALGTGSDLVRSQSSVDVIDADSLELIATIPLGLAGLGFSGLVSDPTGRVALVGAAAGRSVFAVDLAALDDPGLGLGPEALPIVLDGSTPGFRDARVFDAEAPFHLPKRIDGPSDSQCTTQTSVAIEDTGDFAVATDFCDGTISILDIRLPASRATPLEPTDVLALDRLVTVAAPLVPSAIGLIRAIDRVLIRPGTPGVDFTGPEVHVTAGLPEGALCGVRIDVF